MIKKIIALGIIKYSHTLLFKHPSDTLRYETKHNMEHSSNHKFKRKECNILFSRVIVKTNTPAIRPAMTIKFDKFPNITN